MHAASRTALREFGANFLSPILSVFVRSIVKNVQDNHIPVCLAREGYILERSLNALSSNGLINLPVPAVYLKVSRTILFRALLGEEKAWEIILKPAFSGTLMHLLSSRFMMSVHEAEEFLSPAALTTNIELPSGMDIVLSIFKYNHETLKEYAKPTKQGVLDYFQREGLNNPDKTPLFLDVGYSGTIQKLITLLLNRDTEGLYLIASNPGVSDINGKKAKMKGIVKENVEFGEHYPLLERSLFLESIMTAPHAQVIDIWKSLDETFHFIYGRAAPTQRHAHHLASIHDGALEQIIDFFVSDIHFSNKEIESIYEVFATISGGIPHSVGHLFAADDEITGNGIVDPLKLFGMA